MTDTRTAVVTGASRGIGKASAIALAAAGYEVAITARTMRAGEGAPEPSGRVAARLPGSLEETVSAIEAIGGRAHPVHLDLTDRDRIPTAAEECVAALGHVDVLLNNAVYTGPGNYGRFLEDDPANLEVRIFGNVTAQLLFTQPILSSMVARGRGGLLLSMTSAAAYAAPFALPGEGGWGIAYTVSKAGFHRIAVQVAYEYAAEGIVAFNLQPGMVATERVTMVQGPVANIARRGAAPDTIGAAVAHVATHVDAFESGSTIQLQELEIG